MIRVDRSNTSTGKTTQQRGVQFLKTDHVTEAGKLAKITKVTTDKPDNFGNPYVVYFEIDGQRYSKGYSPTSDALATLVELLGEDEKKWIGKTIVIGKSNDPDQGTRLTYAKTK